jgi:hypothetical protein
MSKHTNARRYAAAKVGGRTYTVVFSDSGSVIRVTGANASRVFNLDPAGRIARAAIAKATGNQE